MFKMGLHIRQAPRGWFGCIHAGYTRIKSIFAALTLALLASTALAMDAEVSVGVTKYSHVPDGVWYQTPFPHSFDLTGRSWSVGAAGYVLPGLRIRAGYWYLGRMASAADVVSSDLLYGLYGAGAAQYVPFSHWYSSGSVSALYVTAAPEFTLGEFVVSPELGLNLERPEGSVFVPDYRDVWFAANGAVQYSNPYPRTLKNDSSLWLGLSWGASVRWGPATLALTRIGIRSGGEFPILAGWYTTKYATNLSVRLTF